MKDQESRTEKTNEHLANERTLLAWVRTAIGIMAFGFVVVKFSLFIRQMAIVLGKSYAIPNYGYSGPVGILLVILGAACLVFGAWRYRLTAEQLRTGGYRPQSGLLYSFVFMLLLVSIILVVYLVRTT